MRWFLLLLLAGAALAPRAAGAEPRVALVIGNSNYGALGLLPNPVNDAKLIADTLRKVGFDVVEVEDGDQQAMKKKIIEFGDKLAGKKTCEADFFLGEAAYANGDRAAAEKYLGQAADAKVPDQLAYAAAKALLAKIARE